MISLANHQSKCLGVHITARLREIHAFKLSYIDWLRKQQHIKDKSADIYEEAKEILE
jgi:hypothetical protein